MGTGNMQKVIFIREDLSVLPTGNTATYRIHRASNAATAKQFLKNHPVNKPLLYIIVETPEGIYGRDIQGIYRE